MSPFNPATAGLAEIYRALHAHPELAGQEHWTASVVAKRLVARGWQTTEGIGGTGVVGVLANGVGPVVLLRADMDGLPVRETTGLPYASTRTAIDGQAVMHACGHDMHVTCLLSVVDRLSADLTRWAGTVLAVFQPAEENAAGARAMIDDGLFDRFPKPDICLGQHVGPLPNGLFVLRPGPLMAAADSLRVRLFGRGGHGANPRNTVDPIVMASAVVLRLQAIVSRELGADEFGVLTVGSLHAGTAANVIPGIAELDLNIRTTDPQVRRRLLDAVERVVWAEAMASGAPREPEIVPLHAFPLLVNDTMAAAKVAEVLGGRGRVVHILQDALTASEDFGLFGEAAGCPSVYWHFGGDDSYTDCELADLAVTGIPERIPVNHSSDYAPAVEPTITIGSQALFDVILSWLST